MKKEDAKMFDENNDSNSIKYNPGSEKFEKKAVKFAEKKYLNENKLKYPCKKANKKKCNTKSFKKKHTLKKNRKNA